MRDYGNVLASALTPEVCRKLDRAMALRKAGHLDGNALKAFDRLRAAIEEVEAAVQAMAAEIDKRDEGAS